MNGPKYHFAAIPTRALDDHNLSGADFRVLGAISYFDRMAKNGSGCYATQARLAEITGLTVPTISTSIKKLVALEYLTKQRQENRRRFQYFVVHDLEPPRNVASSREESDTSADAKPFEDDTSANDEVSTPETSADAETNRFLLSGSKDIPLRGVSREKISPKRGAPDGAPLCFLPAEEDDVGHIRAKAARLERWAKANTHPESDVVAEALLERIEEITEDNEEIGHVQRIFEEMEPCTLN